MSNSQLEIIRAGDENGNDMVARIELSSGREIFACGTKNVYEGAWDVGPTWNYLVTGDEPFLVDAGRKGTGGDLLQMIEAAGFAARDLACVVLSHGHEDHDGGLSELLREADFRVYAHRIYSMLNRTNRSLAPTDNRQDMPASCWHCPMPVWFSTKFCREYHEDRTGLNVLSLECSSHPFGKGIQVFHVPGHAPDAITMIVDGEAMLVGDTILPDITPHPTREQFFELTRGMLNGEHVEAQQLYGLRAYLRSLKKLDSIARERDRPMLLPGHRLFYKNRWNMLDPAERIEELFVHHIQRCSDILDLLAGGPREAKDVAADYFEPSLLEGFGMNLAVNEILSHCELMEQAGDVVPMENGRFAATGTKKFEAYIRGLS